jgi:hypothetical protein
MSARSHSGLYSPSHSRAEIKVTVFVVTPRRAVHGSSNGLLYGAF